MAYRKGSPEQALYELMLEKGNAEPTIEYGIAADSLWVNSEEEYNCMPDQELDLSDWPLDPTSSSILAIFKRDGWLFWLA